MRLTLLGTGTSQGVPVIACSCEVCRSADPRDSHLRTSALLETDEGKNILIDIGPDFRTQMLVNRVEHVDAILLTHPHRDHVAGIDDIRPLNYMQKSAIDIYGNAFTLRVLKHDYAYIFAPHQYPGLPEAQLHEVESGKPFMAAGCQVLPLQVMHKDMPILAYRFGKLAYITDANYIGEQEMAMLEGVEVLVVNALRKEKHFSHFCLEEALHVVEQLHPRQAVLTHVSHEMGLYAEVAATLPQGVTIGTDGMTVEV
ncbi:MAG: MBL fold metallo-hydrolase [Bacteroidales bacterium]|nr:MBL fold metallo-hydrolase [Bacteroidales bacterium]